MWPHSTPAHSRPDEKLGRGRRVMGSEGRGLVNAAHEAQGGTIWFELGDSQSSSRRLLSHSPAAVPAAGGAPREGSTSRATAPLSALTPRAGRPPRRGERSPARALARRRGPT